MGKKSKRGRAKVKPATTAVTANGTVNVHVNAPPSVPSSPPTGTPMIPSQNHSSSLNASVNVPVGPTAPRTAGTATTAAATTTTAPAPAERKMSPADVVLGNGSVPASTAAFSSSLPSKDPRFQRVVEFKEQGNAAFIQQDFKAANLCYQQGLSTLDKIQKSLNSSTSSNNSSSSRSPAEPTDTDPAIADLKLVSDLRSTLYSNLAMVHLKQHQYAEVVKACNQILEPIGPNPIHIGNNNNNNNGGEDDLAIAPLSPSDGAAVVDVDPLKLAKLYYRRGLAQERMAQQEKTATPSESSLNDKDHPPNSSCSIVTELYTNAIHDWKKAQQILNQVLEMARNEEKASLSSLSSSSLAHTEWRKLLTTVQVAQARLEQQQQQDPTTTTTTTTTMTLDAAPGNNQNRNHSREPPPAGRPTVTPLPSREEQRTTIRRLLENRATVLWRQQQQQQQQQQDSESTNGNNSSNNNKNVASTADIVEAGAICAFDEALFLLDWDWWCDWCRYVGFVVLDGAFASGPSQTDTTEVTGKSHGENVTRSAPARPPQRAGQVTAKELLSWLPPGASLPELEEEEDDEDDEGEKNVQDGNGGIKPAREPRPPGPIDNYLLFLLPPDEDGDTITNNKDSHNSQTAFYRQWYQSRIAAAPKPEAAVKANLVRAYHFEVIPREVYAAFRAWYGEITPPVCRRVQRRTASCGNNDNGTNGSCSITAAAATTTTTTTTTISSFLYLPLNDWSVASSLDPLATSVSTSTLPEPLVAYSGPCFACQRPGATSRCVRCSVARYCSRSCQESHWTFHKATCKRIASMEGTINSQEIELLFPPPTGRVGLNNLGNTCFMNSALQSLSHASPLTKHFLSNKFKGDLNPSNPLGTGGKLAVAYELMLKDLWFKERITSTSPTALKRAISLFAPRFAGFQQHDTQEFLAYLLDGLHEDLNRIRNAPYVEMPDVTDGQNMVVAGARAWDAHRRRNDSLVMDTFYGQFRSTCVCPTCSRVSVAFDSFNHVSLEIPQKRRAALIDIPVVVFTRPTTDGEAAPIPRRYNIQLPGNKLVSDLRNELVVLSGLDANQFHLCDIFQNAIVEMLPEKAQLSSLRSCELVAAYEASPFSSETVHVVASQRIEGIAVSRTSKTKMKKMQMFGLPFMTSFSMDYTCKQVWNLVWKTVERAVIEDASQNEITMAQMLLRIRVHDGQGKLIPIFPEEREAGEPEEGNAETKLTSMLPQNDDEKISTYLGSDMAESFLFLWLDWEDFSTMPEIDGSELFPPILEEKFSRVLDDETYTRSLAKPLPSPTDSGVTLPQCFDTFTRPERLDENNTWYCSQCKEHVRAMKTMELWRLPNILIVHLKRFEFKNALRRDKLDTLVNFPLNGLDMSEHCASRQDGMFAEDNVPAIYDLFAVTNHYGRMGFGHYTAFARRWDESSISSEWSLFDDSNVRQVDNRPEVIATPAAYVLFYRRRIFN